MHLRQFAVVTLVLFAVVRPICAENTPECTRAGNYGGNPVSIGLIAPHPISQQDAGPQLVAPANHPSTSVAQTVRINDSNVRLASNENEVRSVVPSVRLNDDITFVKAECGAPAADCNKSECESCCKQCESNCKACKSCCKDGDSSCKDCKSCCNECQSLSCVPADIRPVSVQEVVHDETVCPASANVSLLREKEAQLASLQQEVNQLRGEENRAQQIAVKIQMLEVSLTKLRKTGTDFNLMPGGGCNSGSSCGLQGVMNDSPVAFSRAPASVSQAMIEWLCQNNIAKAIAEPNIVVTSGRPAELCVGGEVPIPGRNGSPAAVEFQKFGTQVNLLASALGEDRVHLELRTRISEIDESHSLRVGDSVVPAFSVRECDTAIESKFDQSTVLCGGIESYTVSVEKEGQGNVEENNEIALILVVTPESFGPVKTAARSESTTK